MEKSQGSISIRSVISTREQRIVIVIFVVITLLLSTLMVEFEAFEAFYEYSRSHESWELDEILLVLISVVIALAFSALLLSVIIGRRMLTMARAQVEFERQLVNGRKQQALGSMLGGLSHSLNNHLLPILTIARLLKSEHPQDSQIYEDLDHVQQAAEGARLMLQQVLNFTRQEESDYRKSCIVTEAVDAGLKLAAASMPSTVTLQKNIPESAVMCPISRVNLEIILLNLIMNSVDAIESKDTKIGNIQVSVTLPTAQNGQTDVSIEVQDNGCGLTDEQKQRMFDPFYTTKAVGKGTGLGLAETQGIVNSAGGDIMVKSVYGESTTITLKLPVVA